MRAAWVLCICAAASLVQGCDRSPEYRIQAVRGGEVKPAAVPPQRPASAMASAGSKALAPQPEELAAAPRLAASAVAPAAALPAAGASAAFATARDGMDLLLARSLIVPVEGIAPESLVDTYTQSRGTTRVHEAIDILAARGTPVRAVDDGKLVKLFNSKAGGLTVYQFDPQERLAYYYAHLDRYADGLKEGMPLRRGDLIGYVGVSGNANPATPHLHFAVFRLGPERRWWKGEPVNPYPALRRAAPAPTTMAIR